MKRIKILLSVVVMLLVSGGVAYAVVQNINSDGTQNQVIQGGSNINVTTSSGTHTIGFSGVLGVARGGTGRNSFTSGSILFSLGASISQDNANFFWDDTNNRLGVGTNTPTAALDVQGEVKATKVTTNTISATGTNQSLALNPTGTGRVIIGGDSIVIASKSSEPGSPKVGQIYFDTTLRKFRGYNGTSWISFLDTSAPPNASVSYLIIAGGGGGGGSTNNFGGGGGAGGYQYNSEYAVTVQAYSVIIGTGGGGGSAGLRGNNGASSSFGSITSRGGGGGGGSDAGQQAGANGGSGGGTNGVSAGGTGTSGQGNNGGIGNDGTGGGGGAGFTPGTSGAGGSGGGGAAGNSSGAAGGAGSANTGGGGGGAAGTNAGGNGGSGIVIISFPTGSLTATGGTITTSGGNTIHTFTSSGTFTITAI